MRTFTERWKNLQQCINRIPEKEASSSVLVVIIKWLQDNPGLVAHEYFRPYNFEKYLKINPGDYCFEIFELSPVWLERVKNDIDSYSRHDIKIIPQYLRDLLDMLLVSEVSIDCRICSSPGLAVYFSESDGYIVYECRQCGFAMRPDGVTFKGHLRIARNNELKDAKFI